MKYFEDTCGFIYKRVNENEKTVYLDCYNAPTCLAAAKFYKKNKEFRLYGNHADFCPPDVKVKTKIHFEAFLKKNVTADENVGVSVLNIYKKAVKHRYEGLWLPENHRQTFLPVLRRIRGYQKTKPKNSKPAEIESSHASPSPLPNLSPLQNENSTELTAISAENDSGNEQVCVFLAVHISSRLEIHHNITKLY